MILRLAIAVLIALIVTIAVKQSARAHGEAEWIQREEWKNALGQLCCGERDCSRLADDDVKPVDGGYLIKSRNEFVPTKDTLPVSPDGYWVCVWGGARKCFFTPLLGI